MFRAALEGKVDAAREIREAIEEKTGSRQENFDPQGATFVVKYASPVPGLAPLDASVSDASASDRSIA